MCGIFCLVSRQKGPQLSEHTENLLKQRGPDHYACVEKTILISTENQEQGSISLLFAASVLGLRRNPSGAAIAQPVEIDGRQVILCWNGEVWSFNGQLVEGSDTLLIASALKAAEEDVQNAQHNVLSVLSSVRGPFAMIYFSRAQQKLYFGRDPFGRRSLLRARMADESFVLSSVADKTIAHAWDEVEADGIYVADLSSSDNVEKSAISVSTIPYCTVSQQGEARSTTVSLPWGRLDMTVPSELQDYLPRRLSSQSKFCLLLHDLLLKSIQTRLPWRLENRHPPIAVLFSGGLDCTLLARLAHDSLLPDVEIDLVNVAFENPRIHKDLAEDDSPYELCPDRVTARQSIAELRSVCPNRAFNLICVDVPFLESCNYKEEIRSLIYPHDTEMDISIAMALFFAARGATRSRVLFSGLGADELFGGYHRHALAFKRGGYTGLLDEINLDISRLGKRNLGRDDRVISRWGKEVRYPYLDEDVVKAALEAPVWDKVGFGFERMAGGEEIVDLDDKLVLRCVAVRLGLRQVANEKKRAIQFGTRSAKMESGRTKGTQKIS